MSQVVRSPNIRQSIEQHQQESLINKNHLHSIIDQAKEKKLLRLQQRRLKPIVTQSDIVQNFTSNKQIPIQIGRQSPQFRLRKPTSSIQSSQLDISIRQNPRSHPNHLSSSVQKRLLIATQSNTPKQQFRSLSKKLQARYFSSRSKGEILSPYNKKKQKVEFGPVKTKMHRRPMHKSQPKAKDYNREQSALKQSNHIPSSKHQLADKQQQILEDSADEKPTNEYNLTEKQLEMFGERFPEKFQKVKLLGRGGFSLVWLGIHKKSKKPFAIKQIITKNNHQTHLKEIWFGNFFFEFGGTIRQEFEEHPGINHLIKLFAYDIKPDDTWLFYELCESTLGSALYSLKPEYIDGEKKYKISYKHLYKQFINDPSKLRKLIIEMSKTLVLLGQHNIVHSDIKTENILLLQTDIGQYSYKLIDYGSTFLFTNLKQFTMATPEYMAPQILNFILFQNEMEYDKQSLRVINHYNNESAIDIWSLGCILLQIIHGVPLWLTFKTSISTPCGTYHDCEGLFSVRDRNFKDIVTKQIQSISNLDKILDEQCLSGINVPTDVRHILKGMLKLDPNERMRPRDILAHLKQPYTFKRVYFKQH